jgi:hypothetical protein
LASFRIEQDAVASIDFNQTLPLADTPDALRFEFQHVDLHGQGQRRNFGPADPNVARIAGAAVAAAGALELEALAIPGRIAHRFFSNGGLSAPTPSIIYSYSKKLLFPPQGGRAAVASSSKAVELDSLPERF